MSHRFRLFFTGLTMAALLWGCSAATHISREQQLSHVTTAAADSQSTEAADESQATAADTTLSPTETTLAATEAETVPTTRDTIPPDTAKPPATKSTVPKTTDPPQTTAPATVPDTEPTALLTDPAPTEDDPYDISDHTCGPLEYALHDALNACREEAGLDPLTLSGQLSAISSVRAWECSLSFSHTRPNGTDCFTVLSDYGYSFSSAAENLLQCSEGYTASDMVTLWMGSAGHRANILDPGLSTVGIGVYRSNGMIYVATIFTD